MNDEFILFSGTANPTLADHIARHLGISLGECQLKRFPDGEVSVRLDESVRQKAVFILQPTSPPVNDHLMELLAFTDACRRDSAKRITAVIPYFGYARADKRHGDAREPITASVVAEILQAVGIDQVVTLDLHAPQIEGFFRFPVDSLSAVATLADTLVDKLSPGTIVVSPDTGRMAMATEYAQRLKTSVAVLHKHRESGSQTTVTRVVGEVHNRPCLIVDDMISTGGTIARSIDALLEAGAKPEFTVAATHGLLMADAREKLAKPSLKALYITDTIAGDRDNWPELQVVSVAPLLATAIDRFIRHQSLNNLSQAGLEKS